MKCHKAQALMPNSLYGELSPRKQKAFERHLQRCPDCAGEFARHKATSSLFRELDIEKPPPNLTEIVKEMAVKELEQEALLSRNKSFSYWKPAMASAAAAVLLVVTVIYYLPRAQSEKKTASEPAIPQTAGVKEAEKVLPEGIMHKEEAAAAPRSDAVPAGLPAGALEDIHQMMESPARKSAMPSAPDKLGETNAVSGAAAPSSPEIRRESYRTKSSADTYTFSVPSTRKDQAPEKMLKMSPSALPYSSRDSEDVTVADEMLSNENRPYEQKEYSSTAEAYRELLWKGNQLFDQKEYDSAAQAYRQALQLAPIAASADARFRLGQAHQRLNHFDEALVEFEYIIKNHHDYPSLGAVYLSAGDCLAALGRPEDAMSAYETARDRFPELREEALKKLSSVTAQNETAGAPKNDSTAGE